MSIIVQQIIQLNPCLRTLRRRWMGYYVISCWETLRTSLCELVLSALTLDLCDNSRNKSQFSKEGFIGGVECVTAWPHRHNNSQRSPFLCMNGDREDSRMQSMSPNKAGKSNRWMFSRGLRESASLKLIVSCWTSVCVVTLSIVCALRYRRNSETVANKSWQ